jgi:hypothetical protein
VLIESKVLVPLRAAQIASHQRTAARRGFNTVIAVAITPWRSSMLPGKEGANYQIQIGALFRYDRCPELRRPDSIDLIAAAWLACKPLVDLKR